MDIKDRIIMAFPLCVITLSALVAVFSLILGNLVFAAVFLIVAIILIVIFLRKIPAAPPHVGLVTIWGQRKPVIKKEGMHLFAPIPPFFYDVITVNVEKRNTDLHPQDVRTKEKALLNVKVSITWTPDKEDGENLIQYINAGGEEGVINILNDMSAEAIRIFAVEKSWQECLAAKEDISKHLASEITGDPSIDLVNMRRGNGLAKIPTLGIILNRLNIGEISVEGELAKEAELTAREERQREGEKIELQSVKERIEELKALGLSAKDAAELVQIERGKVKKEIKEFKGFEGLGEGIAKAVEAWTKKGS